MKPAVPDMIKGTEAWERLCDAARKMISIPKSANPFSKPKGKRNKQSAKKQR
jgi:hypothetical protein